MGADTITCVTTPGTGFAANIGVPATRALIAAGYSELGQLAAVPSAALKKLHGVGPKALRLLQEALAQQGKSLGGAQLVHRPSVAGPSVSRTSRPRPTAATAPELVRAGRQPVRHYTPICRHLVLTMAAVAVCAITAALARPHTSTLARPPTAPHQLPPEDPGLIALTVAETRRVFNLVTRTWQPIRHYLRWSWGGIRPEPAGSTSEHACASEQPAHDPAT